MITFTKKTPFQHGVSFLQRSSFYFKKNIISATIFCDPHLIFLFTSAGNGPEMARHAPFPF